MNRFSFLISCFTCLLLISVLPLNAQTQATDTLVVEIDPIRSSEIIKSELTLLIKITNASTAQLSMTLDQVDIFLPGELQRFYKLKDKPRKIEIPPQKNVVLNLVFEPISDSSWIDLKTIFFLPGDYRFTFILHISDTVDKRPFVKSVTEDVRFKPPLKSLLFGGVLGAMLLTAFATLYKVKKKTEGSSYWEQLGNGFLNELGRAVIIFFLGSIVSLITILIIQRVSDFSLPISVKVEDYIGGAIVGMFSIKLADTLFDMLVVKKES